MELVANVWPVVDTATGFVLRFFVRAYCMDAPDDVISDTLKALARTDFRIAVMFTIPKRFVAVSEYGSLEGCVSTGTFHEHEADILEQAFRVLEADFAKLQGIAVDSHHALGVGVIPRFPKNPYLLVTSLREGADGSLLPVVKDSATVATLAAHTGWTQPGAAQLQAPQAMTSQLVEHLTALRFRPTSPEVMEGRVEDVQFVAVVHPLKGLALIVTQVGKRKASHFETFVPVTASLEEIAAELGRAFLVCHPERREPS